LFLRILVIVEKMHANSMAAAGHSILASQTMSLRLLESASVRRHHQQQQQAPAALATPRFSV